MAEESLTPEWGETLSIYFSASQEIRTILKIIDFDDGDTLHSFILETSQFKDLVTDIFFIVLYKTRALDIRSKFDHQTEHLDKYRLLA